jgi:hypothetical protein
MIHGWLGFRAYVVAETARLKLGRNAENDSQTHRFVSITWIFDLHRMTEIYGQYCSSYNEPAVPAGNP